MSDKQLEDHTQKELNDIHKGLNRQMDEILARQNRKNQTAIEELKKDFEEKQNFGYCMKCGDVPEIFISEQFCLHGAYFCYDATVCK